MQLHMSQLPQAVQRLVEDFPQLEVILNNLQNTPTGDILEIINLHDQKIAVLQTDVANLEAADATANNRLTALETSTATTQADLDTLEARVAEMPTGVTANGVKLNGEFALQAGANISLIVNEASKTITITASGTNAADGVPVGTIAFFAAMTAPAGWMECDGREVSRSEYSDLFNAIGTLFGAGDGTTTFNLPDLRGEFIRGWDHNRGVDVGRGFGTAQADAIKDHKHFRNVDRVKEGPILSETQGVNKNYGLAIQSGFRYDYYPTDGQKTGPMENGDTETRPRNIAMLPCIRVKPVEKSLTEAVASLEARMSTAEPKIDANMVQISCVKSKISTIDTQVTAIQSAISDLQTVDSQILDQLTLIQQTIDSLKSDIAEIKEVISMAYVTQEELNAVVTRINALESNVTGLQSSLDNLNEALSNLNALASNLETSVSDLGEAVSNLDNTVAQLNAAQEDLQQAQEQVRQTQGEIQRRMTADKSVTPTSMLSSISTFQAGVNTEFELFTYANENEGEMVLAYFTKPEEMSSLEYLEVQDGNWYPLVTEYFGPPATGFPLQDISVKFRATLDTPGSYEMPIEYRRVSDQTVIASVVLKFNVE
jgi:predicted  nucleic acid-binding Zn-ribbon protein